MMRRLLSMVLVVTGVAAAGQNAAAVVNVDMDPVTAGVQANLDVSTLGQQFTVDIRAENISNVNTMQVRIGLIPGKLTFVSASSTAFPNGMPPILYPDSVVLTWGTFGTPVTAADQLLGSVVLQDAGLTLGETVAIDLEGNYFGTPTDFDVFGAMNDGTYHIIPPQYTVTVSSAAGGSVLPTSLVVDHGIASSDITATPDACHTFNQWEVVSGTVTINAPTNATTTVTATSDATIHATYTTIEYTLTVNDDGNGTTTGDGTVSCGVASAITATPSAGYSFVDWTVSSGTATFANAANASTTCTVTGGDATIQANFALNTYTVTVNSAAGGSVAPATLSVTHGVESGTATATPDACHTFAGWTVTSGTVTITSPSTAATTVTATSDATIEATYTIIQHNLTVNNDGNGTTTGGGNVDCGVASAITATPNTGYSFDSWTVLSGTATFGDVNAASTDVTVTGGVATIQANFVLDSYDITVNAGANGSVAPSGAQAVDYGDSVQVTATADVHCSFLNWTVTAGAANVTVRTPDAATTFVVLSGEGDATVQANFAVDTYTLTMTAGANGSVSPSGGQTVAHGDSVEVTATADQDYQLVDWTVVSGASNVTIRDDEAETTWIIVTGDAEIIANFEPAVSVTTRAARIPVSYGLSMMQGGVQFAVPAGGNALVSLVNMKGETVARFTGSAGYHTIDFAKQGISSGRYLCSMNGGNFSQTLNVMVSR